MRSCGGSVASLSIGCRFWCAMTDWLDPRTFPVLSETPTRLYVGDDVSCLLDWEDYLWAVQWRWSVTPSRSTHKLYITRMTRVQGRQVKLYLHKEILRRKQPVPPSPQHTIADHRDSDSLHNTRSNLRWATPSMNRLNIDGVAARQGDLFEEAA
jgi:hypothetical protein